jgi:small basic protein (TIGR04137 family)
MSIDRSLKIRSALIRHRNVLTRAERVEKLKDEGRWLEGQSTLGLPKVIHRKSHAGKKAKEAAAKEAAPGEALAATAETPAVTGEVKKGETKKPEAKKPEAKKTEGKKGEGRKE